MSRVERFKKRKSLLNDLHSKPDIRLARSHSELTEFLDSEVDTALVNSQKSQSESFYNNSYDLGVTEAEIQSYLAVLDKKFNARKYSMLFDSTKDVIIDQLVRPLGLNRQSIALRDVNGGPVTTLNNFKQGVTATEQDRKIYDDYNKSQNNFDDKPYRDHKFKNIRKQKLQNSEYLTDGYTGKEIPKDGRSHLEHITSAHQIEIDPKAHLGMNQSQRVEMASDDRNLTMIGASMNQSKGDKDFKVWLNTSNAKDKTKLNGEYYGVDKSIAYEKYKKSTQFINQQTALNYTNKLFNETVVTSVSVAKDVGLQQAIGYLFSELISAIFSEVKDAFVNGFKKTADNNFWDVLKKRLSRICQSVLGNWQVVINALQTGLMGTISAFVSNLCTVLVNLFVKTSKNIVRIIREGFLSLMAALKYLFFPPEGMSVKQGAHEASKILATGTVMIIGGFAEEAFSTYLSTLAIPFSGIISGVAVGLATGLSSLFVVFMLDKLDLFGVNTEQRALFIQGKVNVDFEKKHSEAIDIIKRMGIVNINQL
ncbi:hypothetical protein GLP21_18660 [Photobacterium carnosum]|uniref:hypothetical protein n=1 Tax=Photobacterium carnosum TaxID=2023717 RepID=UPI001E5CE98B|nr:hypothetical protein [Photobacterium carnosum]MCD9550641.1 hypothetical protein [Photobacterium carnosum]MCF2307795.1 hypothetical protein [Photobacterium carnosum]